MTAHRFVCTICGGRIEDDEMGFLRWWKDGGGVVWAVSIVHREECLEQDDREREDEFDVSDHHIPVFCGSQAFGRFSRLTQDYTWTPEALVKLSEFFEQAVTHKGRGIWDSPEPRTEHNTRKVTS